MAHLEGFKGNWEELTTHAETFKGRQIRLIVLPVAAETTASITDELQLRSNSNFGSQEVLSLGLSVRASLDSSLSPLIMKSMR